MKALARNGFSAAQVKAALHGRHGTRRVRFRYELLDKYNQPRGWLTTVQEASVTHDAEAEIKRTARFTIRDDGTINWLSDRIRPWMGVWVPGNPGGWVDWPLGVFLLSSPRRKRYREVEAYDQCQVLLDDVVTSRYLIPAGTRFDTAIRTVLESAGIVNINMTPTDKVLPVDREWEPGTPRLTIVNDLLRAINYQDLWFDSEGAATAAPYVTPDQAPAEYTYADDDESVVTLDDPVEEEMDLFNVPNKWVLVVSDPQRPPLRAEYTNTSGNSPTSTVNRGRVIVDYREVDAADQETLDALARRLAVEASQVYQTIRWTSWLMPHHEHLDVYTLTFSQLGISARYQEVRWSMDLRPGGNMVHECRRVVTV
ncbi:MAG: hypothetical protein DIU70_003705 [Bacillota bacterium]|nr:MAG: hypothetical protein DIU70_00825 [Bacillota bacterium]